MFFSTIPTKALLLSLHLLVSGSLLPSFGQQQVETLQTKESDDVLRINTNLMQVQCRLPPGLYLGKVASQERRSGRKGNAAQWVEIPDLKQGQFALGSLFIEEQVAGDPTSGMASPAEVPSGGWRPSGANINLGLANHHLQRTGQRFDAPRRGRASAVRTR